MRTQKCKHHRKEGGKNFILHIVLKINKPVMCRTLKLTLHQCHHGIISRHLPEMLFVVLLTFLLLSKKYYYTVILVAGQHSQTRHLLAQLARFQNSFQHHIYPITYLHCNICTVLTTCFLSSYFIP